MANMKAHVAPMANAHHPGPALESFGRFTICSFRDSQRLVFIDGTILLRVNTQ